MARTLSEVQAIDCAQELAEAERTRCPVDLFTTRFPGFSWADARAIARVRDQLRLGAGDECIGYKLGWTSEAMRQALGISQPNWGTLWRSQLVGSELELSDLVNAKLEPELVYQVGPSPAEGRWALGLEVVDPRFGGYHFDWLDNTADNSSCSRVTIGNFVDQTSASRPDTFDPAAVAIRFTDGVETHHGLGSSVMGSPASAVEWLSTSLTEEGMSLDVGHIVFTGGLAPPFDVTPGTTYRVEADDPYQVLGTVELTTAAKD